MSEYRQLIGAEGVELGVEDGELVIKTGGVERARVTSGGISTGTVEGVNAMAEELACVAWTFDPAYAVTLATHTSGNIHAAGVLLKKGDVITKMGSYLGAAAVSPTHFFLGIYDSNYNLVASTPDSPNSLLSTGYVEVALSQPWTCPADGIYYFADLYAAGTMPTVLVLTTVTQGGRSLLPSSPQYRAFNPGSVNSSFPNPIVPSTSGAFNFIYAR